MVLQARTEEAFPEFRNGCSTKCLTARCERF